MKNIIFGYGSLIGTPSLLQTAPNAQNIRPAYITGFRREFNLWDPVGYTEYNLDVANIPFTAVDVVKNMDPHARVNGVVFEVDDADFEKLLLREEEYLLVQAMAYDYYAGHELGICQVFSAGKNNASFCFGLAPQMRYIEDILTAAKKYGGEFYQEFLSTTFIADTPLDEEVRLQEFLSHRSND